MRKNVRMVLGMIAAGSIAATGPASAQMQPQAAQPQQSEVAEQRKQLLDEIHTVQERARTLQEKLNEVAEQAQRQNPDLQELHTELMDIYQNKLNEYGYPSENKMQQLRVLQQRLQDSGAGDMDEAEKQRLMQQFNAGVEDMQEAQQKAQNDSEVIRARQAFEQTRSTAMSEVEPEAPALLKELEDIQSKRERLRRKLQQVLQAPQQ